MSVDKLVDSTQLDSDLTSVANAIRTKGGTSASLAFPSGFVSAINAIPTGGGGGGVISDKSVLALHNYTLGSAKWILNSSTYALPNVLKTGGCVHYIFEKRTNSTGSDKQLVGFGVGAMNAWSPSSPNVNGFIIIYNNGVNFTLRLRGSNINATLSISDSNVGTDNTYNIKFYKDKWVNVHTGVETSYASAVQTGINAICDSSYLSIGCNYQVGWQVPIILFALETE